MIDEKAEQTNAATENLDESKDPAAQEKKPDLSPLEKAEAEATEYKTKYLSLLADMDNARKRMLKEKQDSMRYAKESLIVDIITPLDNLENALKCATGMSEEVKQWAIGFQMIADQFKNTLGDHGAVSFISLGEQFDASFHEAVEMQETDAAEEGVITKEFAKGYKCGNQVIRHARVQVAKKLSKGD